MTLAAVLGAIAKPAPKAQAGVPALTLETLVPRAFSGWLTLPEQQSQVVNPLVAQQLDQIYSQILTRTYVAPDGYRIMLSVAYGDDQRGGLQAHRPEVCYPGQGFTLTSTAAGTLSTAYGPIDVRRLQTSLGPRKEPVTYWLTVGDRVVNSQMGKRLAEMRLALTGQIPDGLLFRISSIDADTERAFARQQEFAAQMMGAVPPKARRQLGGLQALGNPS